MTRKKKIEESEEAENQRALDAAAGVARESLAGGKGVGTVAAGGSTPLATVTRPPLPVKADTREKRLYQIASSGPLLSDAFFDEFPDRQEILELTLDISARLLIVGILNGEMPVTQRIAAMRVVASLAGKHLAEEEEDGKFKAAPPLAIPRGSKEEVSATLDKIRQLSGG